MGKFKKSDSNEVVAETETETTETETETTETGEENALVDFDAEEEYVAPLIIPKGSYSGHITEVKLNKAAPCVSIGITLQGNEGVCSDGETPVDGISVPFMLWLAKAGDETKRTKSGVETSRQWKNRQLVILKQKTGIDLTTNQKIEKAVADATYIGTPVVAQVEVQVYEGEESSRVKKFSVVKE